MNLTKRFLLMLGTRYLARHGIESPQVSSELLLGKSLGENDRLALYLEDKNVLSDRNVVRKYFSYLRKRKTGYPLQYIIGEVIFRNCILSVREDVLIPRPETELLVSHAVEAVRDQQIKSIIDMGTGSGNIAISLAQEFPEAKVLALDVSEEALSIAKENIEKNGVSGQITLRKSNCLLSVKADEKCDLLVANPPYIRTQDIASLAREIHYEPVKALDGGEDGLTFYRWIFKDAKNVLRDGGIIVVEIGCDQAKDIVFLAEKHGYTNTRVCKDHTGRDRFLLFA